MNLSTHTTQSRRLIPASALGICTALLLLSGCATESSRPIEATKSASAVTKPHTGERIAVSIGKFENRSNFLRGIFTDGEDRLGNQARTILTTHLQQSGRFLMLDRENIREMKEEAAYAQQKQAIRGARYVIGGDVSEFGRKEVGDRQLFGLLGRGKEQVAYAKVTLNLVDVTTSEVVLSVQGAGEFSLSAREVIGTGGTAGYDSTLNGKVLDLAIREAVDRLVAEVDAGRLIKR